MFEFDALLKIAATGCYLEWDLFGNEGSYYPLAEIDMPSDAQRLDYIMRIVDAGYSEKIVIGQDICTKHRLVTMADTATATFSRTSCPKCDARVFRKM